MAQTQRPKINRKVIFIGKDKNCYKSIKEKFQEVYVVETFTFLELFPDEKNKVLGLLPQILGECPLAVFVDYAIYREEFLNLAKSIREDIAGKNILVIGLVENIDAREVLIRSIGNGIFLNFIKGAEVINHVHHTMSIVAPDIAKDVEYSVAKTSTDLMAKTLFRLVFLNPKYIHLESSYAFAKGTTERILSDLKLTPDLSFNYIVSGEYDFDLRTSHLKSYDFKYDHMDSTQIDFVAKKIDEIEKQLEKNPKDSKLQYDLNERNTELMQALEKANEEAQTRPVVLNKWLEENHGKYHPPKTQVLVIDREMNYLMNPSEQLDALPFKLQILSDFDDKIDTIHRLRPSLVVVNIPIIVEVKKKTEENVEEDETGKDDWNKKLQFVITRIKHEKNYKPFVFVFNYQGSGEDLKKYLNYASVVVSSKPLDLTALTKGAILFESKQGVAVTHLEKNNSKEDTLQVYLSDKDARSNIYYQMPIHLVMLSESDMVFNCEKEIPLYSCLQIKDPVEMTVTIVPFKEKSKRTEDDGKYYGLINGLGEVETNNLRKYVNDLIFADEKS